MVFFCKTLGRCKAAVQNLLTTFWNFAFMVHLRLSGLAIVGLCAFLLVDEQRSKLFRLFRPDDHYALYLALTGTGALALLVGFLGCCVAPKKGSVLAAYVASLLVVMACELAIGTLAFLLQDKAMVLATHISGRLLGAVIYTP
ncbi:hypothetical protein HPB50_015020 [Hyalomma asiaticum]|uniref:Uncharacterized protein n=1 Tax=Hyalomma asiaticum TaxID=266040 RepID=A0ACB7SR06_HYAAI|nr:hypothetical protein HPB50_015020 [Hyalomma asiaticum]